MKYIAALLVSIMTVWGVSPSVAQAHTGFYISSDLGINVSSSVQFNGDSNDVASHCDALTNPGLSGCNPEDFRYSGNFVEDWFTQFDGGQGILAGAAIGYSFADRVPDHPLGGFRVEVEYFFRESQHDETARVTGASGATQDKIERNEFETGPSERLNSLTSHNLFGNLFYDFKIQDSRFMPYLGLGAGLGLTQADWGSNWTRTLDKGNLRDGLAGDGRPDLAGNDTYVDRLAGSSSVAQTTLSDTLYGFQLMLGMDYAVTETMSVGLKGRYVSFASFRDSLVWNPLRSHAPFVGPNNTNPVSGNMSTSDIDFFGVSVNLKYRF